MRVTRNADIDAQSMYDEDMDYRNMMEALIKRRVRLDPVRVELSRKINRKAIDELSSFLEIGKKHFISVKTPLDMSFVFQLQHYLRDKQELFFEKRTPRDTPELSLKESILGQVEKKDVLLSYPFESMKPFIKMLNDAAEDPDVVSIKMTLYRVADKSQIIDALIEAAENGKEVIVLVELRARFDEANNIEMSHRLEDAGCVIVGKTNMDEFAMGSTTETSAFGATKNPWNTEHVPGGSSGGSCAAVAAEEVPFALGSDTGGSIRQPSSFCGVTGIKPTYGTVSRYGLIAYGSSLDQIGPIAKNVTDCATILEAIASYDTKDSTSVNRDDLKFTEALVDDVKGMKIGIPKDYLGDGLDPEVKSAILAAADELKKKGAVVEEFDLGLVEYAIPAYYVIACAEASSNLARFDGVKYGYRTKEYTDLHNMYKKSRSEGFGPEVKRRIMLGSFVLSSGYYDAYYLKALRVKALIKKSL